MNILIKFTVIFFLAMNSSCDSAKSAASENESETKTVSSMDSKYESEGYLSGMVKYQADSECLYIIIDEKSGLQYDPVNIDDGKFETMKKDSQKVYFKYEALRRMNRCENIQPVRITDLQPREN